MSNTTSLPRFPIFPSETARSTTRVPHALASVEHEGTTWLLREYEGLIFFKREEDTEGKFLFVLTETLDDPTPETVIDLWKKCFAAHDWARFGIRDWEGGYDWNYQDKTQHDLCFILAEETGPKPSGLRITTDLSYDEYFLGLPEELIIEDEGLLSYLYTNFKAVSKMGGEKRRNLLLNSPLEDISSEFSTDKKQEWLISDIRYEEDGPRQKMTKKYKDAEQWLEEMPEFFGEVRGVFSIWESVSMLGNPEDLERLLHCACLAHPPGEEVGVQYRATFGYQTPFLAAQLSSLSIPQPVYRDTLLDISNSLNELCNVILDEFNPKGHTYEADHEQSFGSFVPEKIKIKFSAPSAHEKAEALVQLREWLQGKVEAEDIERLLTPA